MGDFLTKILFSILPEGTKDFKVSAQAVAYEGAIKRIILQELNIRQTARIILMAIRDIGSVVEVRPSLRRGCNADTKKDGDGVLIRFSPGYFPPGGKCNVDPVSHLAQPAGSAAEVLFHELIHAFRLVSGKFVNARIPKLPAYDEEDDFYAVVITNIFISETDPNRPLRESHQGHEPLPVYRATDEGFLTIDANWEYVTKFIHDHPEVSKQLRDVPSAFNPVRKVLEAKGHVLAFPATPEEIRNSQREAANEEYPLLSDAYLVQVLQVRYSGDDVTGYGRRVRQLAQDFRRVNPPLAKILVGRLENRKGGDKVSLYFHDHLSREARTALVGILKSRM
jgi:hypothetical protein